MKTLTHDNISPSSPSLMWTGHAWLNESDWFYCRQLHINQPKMLTSILTPIECPLALTNFSIFATLCKHTHMITHYQGHHHCLHHHRHHHSHHHHHHHGHHKECQLSMILVLQMLSRLIPPATTVILPSLHCQAYNPSNHPNPSHPMMMMMMMLVRMMIIPMVMMTMLMTISRYLPGYNCYTALLTTSGA